MDLEPYIEASPFPWFKEWYRNRIGPAEYLWNIRARHPHPKWWTVNAAVFGMPFLQTRQSYKSLGGSLSIDMTDAVTRAIGEAVERYSDVNAVINDTLFAQEVDPHLLEQVPVCDEDELARPSFKASGRQHLGAIPHSMTRSLLDGTEVPIPAEYIHMAYTSPNFLTLPTSNGTAFHVDTVRAIWAGIGECIERDALMCHWLAAKRPPKIIVDGVSLPMALDVRLRRIREAGLKLDLFLTSSEFDVAAVLAVVRSERYPYYSAGGAARNDIFQACIKAIDEAIGGQMYAEHGPDYQREIRTDEFSWVTELDDHTHVYFGWKNTPAFDFLWEAGETISIADLAAESWFPTPTSMEALSQFAVLAKSRGVDVYWKDRTLPELAHAGKVVKVVMPQLIPLIVHYNERWLGSARLRALLGGWAAHPYPHPLP